jgi:anti-repressor protein
MLPQVFNFHHHNIRIKVINHEPYFCVNDICKILEINNGRHALTRIDDGGVVLVDTPTNGGMQKLSYVNEAGLYELIFSSRKKEAKDFKRWVFNEVIPQIRKTGNYVTQNAHQQIDSKFMLKIAEAMKKQEMTIAEQKLKIESQDNTISEISNTQYSYSIRECKSRLMIEENRLKTFLKQKRWIQYLSDGEQGKKIYSTSYSQANGLAIDKTVLHKATQKFFHQCRITKKGMDYLIKHRGNIIIENR